MNPLLSIPVLAAVILVAGDQFVRKHLTDRKTPVRPDRPVFSMSTKQNSSTPRVRPYPTTLSIPGLTKSKISPDGRIASRDIGSKLVIIMVGLPARGKSYITNKLQRYISWQQHRCKVFNVGNRRRVRVSDKPHEQPKPRDSPTHAQVASILINGTSIPVPEEPPELDLNETGSTTRDGAKSSEPMTNGLLSQKEICQDKSADHSADRSEEKALEEKKADSDAKTAERPVVDQSAKFFDPKNEEASKMREQFALESLDELLDYLLLKDGTVGILDATNSTLSRRKALVERINEREPYLPVLFVESICNDPNVSLTPIILYSGPGFRAGILSNCRFSRQICVSSYLVLTTRARILSSPSPTSRSVSRPMKAPISRLANMRKTITTSTSRWAYFLFFSFLFYFFFTPLSLSSGLFPLYVTQTLTY